MNVASSAAATIAAHAAQSQAKVLDALRKERATRPDRAVLYVNDDETTRAQIGEMLKCGILKRVDGKLWIDEDRLAEKTAQSNRAVFWLFLILAVVGMSVLALILALR